MTDRDAFFESICAAFAVPADLLWPRWTAVLADDGLEVARYALDRPLPVVERHFVDGRCRTTESVFGPLPVEFRRETWVLRRRDDASRVAVYEPAGTRAMRAAAARVPFGLAP